MAENNSIHALSHYPVRIELREACLNIPIYGQGSRLIKGALVDRLARNEAPDASPVVRNVEVLQDIDLCLEQGMRVGLTGPNGAGKTSLLRVLAGIYPPTSGTVMTQGRIIALLNLTLGMSQDATGYENILNLAMVFGITRENISEKIQDITKFSELGPALNRPLRTYSSGMRLRLAFAVATCAEPDILLIDEVVSVGDPEFVEKAKNRLQSLINRSKILVVASHSKSTLSALCSQIIRLENGRIVEFATVDEPN
jgi:ABC-type polysaccharide/polyol phosphate transport system ATPase subunit